MLVVHVEDLTQPLPVVDDGAGAQGDTGPDHVLVVALPRIPSALHQHPASGARFTRMLLQPLAFLHLTKRCVKVVQVPQFRVLPLAFCFPLPAVVQHH